MRISDWSSDVCSSDLHGEAVAAGMALAFAFSAEQGLCAAEDAARVAAHLRDEIGRASCRERVCQYVSISVVAVSLKKKKMQSNIYDNRRETDTQTTCRRHRLTIRIR